MKRKIWLFVAIIAILCLSLSYVISYGHNDATIYVNLGKANDSGIGYGIGDPIQVNGKYIWELNQYNSNNILDKVTNPRNLYCIKADYGETWDNGRNPEGIVEYNLYYDLQKERQSLLDRLVDNGNSDLIRELLDPSGPVYRELLWLLDNFYIPGENITDYLTKAGIDANFYAMYNEPTPLSETEVIAVQKAVIWYFTNYLLGNEEIYNNYTEGVTSDGTRYTGWMTKTEDSGITYEVYADNGFLGDEGICLNDQIVKLYNYLVDSAKAGASLYTEQNNYTIDSGVSIDTTGLTQEDGKYKLTMISKDSNYIVGPIKIINNGATDYDIQLTVQNGLDQTVNYKFTDVNGNEIATDIKDLINNNQEFYLMFDKSNNNKVNISFSITNTTTQKTLWLKGTETDTEITLDGEQPLVEITRQPETIDVEFTADITDFDLALRKNIVEISRDGQTITIDTRKPVVTVTPLDTTTTTANYAHRKDPVTIKTGDIVTYSVTVYNEGLIDGYASKIIDQLPDGLQFIEENNGIYTSTRKDGKTNTYKSSYNPTASSLVVGGETLKPKTILFTIDDSVEVNDLKAHTVVGEELDWETITFKCRVTQETPVISTDDANEIKENTVTLTNVAWIAEDSNDSNIDDRDSQPENSPNVNNSSLNTSGDDVGYTGKDDYTKDELGNSNKYYEGEQDDDDFEKLELLPEKKVFDLGLKKFIAAVSHDGPTIEDDEYLLEADGVTFTRAPVVTGIYHRDQVGTTVNGELITDTVMFKDHDKTPVLVQNGDYVLYTIRVYNHGEINGYASLIKDSIPEGLEYVVDSSINADYLWNVESYQDSLGKTVITTDYFKKDGMAEENGEKALLQALNPDASISEQNPDYIDVPVLCKVVEPQTSDRILTNYAQISDDTDENGDEIDDIDSTPDEWLGEDDEDIEKVKLQYLDLSLRKFITAINDEELTEADGTYTREPDVDVTPLVDGTDTTAIYNHTKEPVQVDIGDHVIYTIRVYNEGNIDAYASEITDYLPPYLQFDENSQINQDYGWTVSENGRIVVTRYTANTELKAFDKQNPELDYTDVKIECIVKPEVKPKDILTNIAEISEYKYDDTIVEEDIDSESDNMVEDNYLPNDNDLPTYKDNEIGNDYVPGNEDDDDFEKIYIPTLDLSLRKFITAVNDKEIKDNDGTYTREPDVDVTSLVDGTGTTAIYNHTKEPLKVKVGDHVIYTIRVYNEGSIDGYASEITDYLPPHLQFDENSQINKDYGWTVSEDGRKVITNYTANTELKAFDKQNPELDYTDVKIECIVTTDVVQGDKLTNIAEISEYKYGETIIEEDIDSESDNMEEDGYLPEDSDLPTYKDEEIDNDYVPGNEDDDDFEKIYVPVFDLALRKFITQVGETDITTRVPQVKYENGQITYEHTKEPILVHVDDIVTYTIRVYNEGETSGYASEITDDIPDYLEYLPEHETNIQYLWKMYDADGNETENVDEAVKVKTTYLSKENETEDGEFLLNAFDGNIDNLSYHDVQIAFKVKDPNSNSYIITNHAQISDDTDEDGEEIDDEDSTPDEWNEGEDDQDIENVKVEYFDLALLKYVTKVIVIEDGQEKVSKTGYDGTEDPEPLVKVELHRKKLSDVVVKFGFGIKITNEGDIAGYASEITDYVPEGLRFEAADNPGWTDEGNNVISTRLLEGTLLQPGESATVEVILTWINGENNLALKTNTAEISEDDNEHDVPDKDSTPDNQVPGEDDIDTAQVILAVSTGIAKTFFGLGLGLLGIVLVGIILIKRFVL